MKIDFENEIGRITPDLISADSYLECERVIIANIRKHIQDGQPDPVIEDFLNKLMTYFEEKIKTAGGNPGSVNYSYARGFLNTLISAPYWHNWIDKVK